MCFGNADDMYRYARVYVPNCSLYKVQKLKRTDQHSILVPHNQHKIPTNRTHTSEYPRTRLVIQPLHLRLMPLPLIAQLLSPCPISALIRLMTLLETSRHGVAFLISACAYGGVLWVLLVDEVEVLDSWGCRVVIRENEKR